MKYESSILKRLIDTYGVIGNPRYLSEIIKEFIVQGKECYPNLFTYQSDWLAHIDEFGLTPEYTVSYTGQQIYAPNTKERPVKSAILSGKTLVNLLDKRLDITSNQIHKFINREMTSGKKIFIKIKLPQNVTTFMVQVSNLDGGYKRNITLSSEINVVSLSSDEQIDRIKGLDVAGWDMSSEEHLKSFNEAIIIEYQDGMENWDIPYFEGMQSVKMPVLTTVGKNICPPLEFGNFSNLNGEDWETKDLLRSKVIKVEPLTTYKLSNDLSYSYKIIEMDLNYNVIKYSESSTITTTNNTNYIRVKTAMGQNDINVKFQIEKGSVATSYEPYKSNILTVNGDVELRGTGGVQDTLDCLTGEVTERICEIVLDGSETWVKNSYTTGYTMFRYVVPNLPTATSIRIGYMLCDKFNVENYISAQAQTREFITIRNGTTGQLLLNVSNEKANEVTVLKEWLSQNPITVQYQLAENVIKTVDLTILDQNGQNVKQLMSFNGGTHFTTSSQEGSLLPSLSVDVVTDLEETLKVCSLEGNTM